MSAEQDKNEEITWASRLSNLISEKMKDGFFGYLIVSFIIHNWQQIIIVIKSKKPIELVLHSLVSQPHFKLYAFWLPMLYGTIAAFVVPWVLAYYVEKLAIARSRMSAAQHAADKKRAAQIEAEIKKIELETLEKNNEIKRIQEEIAKESKKLKQLAQNISISETRRASFSEFFERLNEVYRHSPEIKNINDFKVFFEKAYEDGIFDDYPRFLLSKDSDWIKQALDKSKQNQANTN
ncbi:hypothetical protein DBY68_016845 [Pseudocitrobacter sp. RIT415]|uniref:hypothetical protein n=1 Tax=Pseudocitrobacter sp. RIT415 TaxID=2202163 RepID=UPI000D370668|nr:hypothetical protein [Pseudocitrobacter sp. RIT 415]RAU45283.1 hypothetical protein DBY68_016845 [Pseudocitrobacter sp. RIT 415]